jgi:hypothetical protein
MSDQDWRIRLAVYQYFVKHARPPTHADIARQMGIPASVARASYRRLHQHHALFLEPGADAIRMANPLSAIPTAYSVFVAGKRLWANCAWDSLGIPAMLAADAQIEAVTSAGDVLHYAVEDGRLRSGGGLVHFALPFARWYDDLIHT